MESKFLKILASSVLATGLILGAASNAVAAYEELRIPTVEQQKDNWCWAACALMAGEYAYSECSYSQSDIVRHVKGSTVDEPGSIWETENALEYATEDTLAASATLSKWSLAKLQGAIDKDYPVIIRLGDSLWEGHFIVLRGYNPDNDVLVFNDPFTNSRETGSYKEIVAGTWKHDSRKYANTVYFNKSK